MKIPKNMKFPKFPPEVSAAYKIGVIRTNFQVPEKKYIKRPRTGLQKLVKNQEHFFAQSSNVLSQIIKKKKKSLKNHN